MGHQRTDQLQQQLRDGQLRPVCEARGKPPFERVKPIGHGQVGSVLFEGGVQGWEGEYARWRSQTALLYACHCLPVFVEDLMTAASIDCSGGRDGESRTLCFPTYEPTTRQFLSVDLSLPHQV